MAADNMSTAHFDARHLHNANNLTVYIDDEKVCSFDGGTTRSVKVTPGHHVIKYLVYNDASEEAYWIGPFPGDFEAGREYDIYPGLSSEELARRQAEESRKNKSSAKAYSPPETHYSAETYGSKKAVPEAAARPTPAAAQTSRQAKKKNSRVGVIAILIAVAIISGFAGARLSSSRSAPAPAQHTDAPSPSAKPAQAQTTKPPVTADVETPVTADVETTKAPAITDKSGLIFPDSDTAAIEQWQLEGLSDEELSYAINELYARHGYIFRKSALIEHFGQFAWYTPEIPADEFSVEDYFNQVEKANWNLLLNERNARRELAETMQSADESKSQ